MEKQTLFGVRWQALRDTALDLVGGVDIKEIQSAVAARRRTPYNVRGSHLVNPVNPVRLQIRDRQECLSYFGGAVSPSSSGSVWSSGGGSPFSSRI